MSEPPFPVEIVKEIAYRAYLARLEPPLTVETVKTYRYVNDKTGHVTDEASIRRNSRFMLSMTRTYLRVLLDMGLIDGEPQQSVADAHKERAALR